jgi:Ca2+-transporting ATPase
MSRRTSATALDIEPNHTLSEMHLEEQESERNNAQQSPFTLSPKTLSKLVDSKSLVAFVAIGGLEGLAHGLRTNSTSGLSLDETTLDTIDASGLASTSTRASPLDYSTFSVAKPRQLTLPSHGNLTSAEYYVDRKRVFGENKLPEKQPKSILEIMWLTFNDKVLIILTIVAAISLTLGLYQDSVQPDDGPKVRWVEGVTIMVAVVIVVVVGSLNDYQKERQFIKLNKTVSWFPYDRIVGH